MKYVLGEILTKNGLEKGFLGFEKNKIVETGKNNPPKKPICKGLIFPSFVNCHTHIGDTFIRYREINLPKNVDKLVAPPNGLKHQLLNSVSDEDIIEGMEVSINDMIISGTKVFCDFREKGIIGICQLKSALKLWNINYIILSRPDRLEYNKNEIDILLKNSDGIGLSSISDWNYSDLEKIARTVKNKKKIFSLHCSERIREDIDLVLDLKPDFLIHMIKANESDLLCVKDFGIPIVICPRSNSFFDLKPNYELLKKTGVNLLIGTDNAMLNNANVIDEIKYIKSESSIFSDEELFNMVTYNARKALNLGPCILGPGYPADFVVLDKKSLDILYVSNSK